jgi:hypothetical protein
MKILGIETSCDETAVCIVEATGDIEMPSFKVLGDALYSQVKTHEQYGGVFPMVAKREHAKNLVPLLKKALVEAELLSEETGKDLTVRGPSVSPQTQSSGTLDNRAVGERGKALPVSEEENLRKILEREQGLFDVLKEFLVTTQKPDIDLIAVTAGLNLHFGSGSVLQKHSVKSGIFRF